MAKDNENIMKDAQYRKGMSIGFFNATNAAIEFAKINGMAGVMDPKKFISEWRDWFIEEHKTYYTTVIANVGSNYKVEDSLKKLEGSKNIVDLLQVWQSFSADERADDVLIKKVQEIKVKLKKK